VADVTEQQVEFVRWWRENVRRAGRSIISAREIIAEDAEAQTGISPVQVSRWGKRLADVPQEQFEAALADDGQAIRLGLYGEAGAVAAVVLDPELAGANAALRSAA